MTELANGDFVVVVDFLIRPEFINEFRTAMARNAAASLKDEPGCLVFDVCLDPAKPERVHLYEVYVSKAAFDEHLKAPHFLDFDQRTRQWAAEKRVEIFELMKAA